MPHARVISCLEEAASLRVCWRDLLLRTPGASFFQSLDWLQVYWRHFGSQQTLRIVVVENEGAVIGIVPLVVRRESTRIGSVRVLTYPLHDWGSFYGPIGPDQTAVLLTCFRALRQMPRDWDLLDLRWINGVEVDRHRTITAMGLAGFPARAGTWGVNAVIDFQGTWSTYLQARRGKFRANLRRAEVQAGRCGEVSFERYRPAGQSYGDGEPRWDIFEECQAIAQASWQGASDSGTTISHPEVREFFRELFAVATRQGALDINLLRIGGRPAAFSFNLHHQGELTGLRLGFDPQLAGASPGQVLLSRSVEDSFRRRDERLDLGSASLAYKRQWMTRTIPVCRSTYYSSCSWRAQILRAKHWWKGKRASVEVPAAAVVPKLPTSSSAGVPIVFGEVAAVVPNEVNL